MRVAVFGGSGATGRRVIEALLAAGMEVRALLRHGASLAERSGLTLVEGSLLDRGDVAKVLQDCDAALCLFGPRPPHTEIFCAAATATIVAAMQEAGIARLICQTGGMIGDYPANRSRVMRRMVAIFNARYPELAGDRHRQEQVVSGSGLQWTILKPPRLTDGRQATGVHAGREVRVGMLSSVSRDCIARWIVRELAHPAHIGEAVFIRQGLL